MFLLVVYGTFIGCDVHPVSHVCCSNSLHFTVHEHVVIRVRHPKFQPVGPLAAGLAIYAAIESGGECPAVARHAPHYLIHAKATSAKLIHSSALAGTYSGAVINPARLIGRCKLTARSWALHFCAPSSRSALLHCLVCVNLIHCAPNLQEVLWSSCAGGAASGEPRCKLHN